MRLRIGTRASALARWQAEWVRAQLAEQGVAAELVLVRTTGDRDVQTPLRALGSKGIFIKELEDALLEDRVDLAVHSMKDVPTELPAGLLIPAILRRDDVRDALVSRAGMTFEDLAPGARVGTSSLRRQAQLRHYRGDLEMHDIRGNVETRLAKLDRGDYDAIVLAKAGLDRLGFGERISETLHTDICLPAAGQGAIGIEARAGDEEVLRILAPVNHIETRIAVDAERAVLAGIEGGCQVPAGIWARIEAREFVIEACVLSADGGESVRVRRAGAPQRWEELAGETAAALLDRGAGRLLGVGARTAPTPDIFAADDVAAADAADERER
jgi:hydroxymethylbilane synthase